MVSDSRNSGFRVNGQFLHLMTMLFAIVATYFLTIQSLRLELSAKAESEVVVTLDKKLSGFEVILKQGVIDKEEFYRFSQSVENRLTRIEQMLADQGSTKIENP